MAVEEGQAIVLSPVTLADLYKEPMPEVQWLAKDLIPLGAVTAITGDSNAYKTFLSCSLAGSVVSGEPFLGHFPTTKGKVLVIDEENHRLFILRKRFEAMGVAETNDLKILSQQGVKLDIEKYCTALKEVLDKERPALLVLDSLVRFHSKEENSSTEMSKVMNAIRGLVADDRAVVVIHHHKKEQGFKRKNSSQNVRGSSDIFASLDCHLAIDRKDYDTSIKVSQNKLRVQEQLQPFIASLVTLENGTIAFEYQGEDTSRQERIAEVTDEVKAVLAASAEPLPLKILREEVDATKGMITEALKLMEDSGELKKGRRARGAYFYSLSKEEGGNGDSYSEETDVVDSADEESDPSALPF